jgi:hypothetical protein
MEIKDNTITNKKCRYNKDCKRYNCKFIHDNLENHVLNKDNNKDGFKEKDNSKKSKYNNKNNEKYNKNKEKYNKKKTGPNTESWDPITKPYDLRIKINDKNNLQSNDVLVVSDIFKGYKLNEIHDKLVEEINNSKVDKEDLLKLWHGSKERNIEGTHLICNDRTNWKVDCPTFNMVIDKLVEYFNVRPEATRLNWYKEYTQWKPLHRDSAAINPDKAKYQDITIAVSFGQKRDIIFENLKSKQVICIPQGDGEVYTFGNDVNMNWKHGVQPGVNDKMQSRISIIIWGKLL